MKKQSPLMLMAGCVFFATLLCALALTAYVQYNRSLKERERMEHIALSVLSETYETLQSQMNKTKVLQAYLIDNNGRMDCFDGIAEMLLDEDYIRNVLFAPDGVVSNVFPVEGNENVVGFDMYSESAGNNEVRAAIETGDLFMAGPFELVQGGLGIAGRQPVFLKDENGQDYLWGIVSITLNFPDVLSGNIIERVETQGYACELWRVDPDSGAHQTILRTDAQIRQDVPIFEREQRMFQSVWIVSIAPLHPWFERAGLWLCAAGSLLISYVAALAVYNAEKIRRIKAENSQREIDRLQEKLEREQHNVMVNQISSHFFYHTLNALEALILLQPDAAYKMVGDFSKYLRFNLDSSSSEDGICTFKEELRAVRAYADINCQQLGDRLTVVYDIPDADFEIPVLTIQPVVENAILHGIKPKIGGGTVTLSLSEQENCWEVVIADDGVGFSAEDSSNGKSIGLSNVRKRLARFQGCSMEISSAEGVGTEVRLIFSKNLRN